MKFLPPLLRARERDACRGLRRWRGTALRPVQNGRRAFDRVALTVGLPTRDCVTPRHPNEPRRARRKRRASGTPTCATLNGYRGIRGCTWVRIPRALRPRGSRGRSGIDGGSPRSTCQYLASTKYECARAHERERLPARIKFSLRLLKIPRYFDLDADGSLAIAEEGNRRHRRRGAPNKCPVARSISTGRLVATRFSGRSFSAVAVRAAFENTRVRAREGREKRWRSGRRCSPRFPPVSRLTAFSLSVT